jgi:hypothetical protein
MTGALLGCGYQTWIVDEKEREFMLRGLRGQTIHVAPKSKLVMAHTAAGNVGDSGTGETLSLWLGVVESLANDPGNHRDRDRSCHRALPRADHVLRTPGYR